MSEATTTGAGTAAGADKAAGSGRWGIAALAAAALVAAGAIGWRVLGDSGTAPATAAGAPASGETPPSVSEVIAGLEQRLAANPEDADGWRMLGWSYFETGKYADAAQAMRRAIKLDPDNAEYHSMLGEALVMASEGGAMPADARAAFEEAVRNDPRDARARYFLAVAKDLDGRHAEAIDDWFALLADTPADAPYAEDVREVIRNVGKERGIDVESRLAAAKFAPPAKGFATDGADVAASGIPGPTRDQIAAAAALPKGQQDAMVQGMVESLEAKLKANPANADGWIMLIRSRMTLGETAKAQAALGEATAAFRNDGQQLRRIREAAAALDVPGA